MGTLRITGQQQQQLFHSEGRNFRSQAPRAGGVGVGVGAPGTSAVTNSAWTGARASRGPRAPRPSVTRAEEGAGGAPLRGFPRLVCYARGRQFAFCPGDPSRRQGGSLFSVMAFAGVWLDPAPPRGARGEGRGALSRDPEAHRGWGCGWGGWSRRCSFSAAQLLPHLHFPVLGGGCRCGFPPFCFLLPSALLSAPFFAS